MKLAISNLAWNSSEEAGVAGLMQTKGLRGLEIAPTKAWPVPLEATEEAVAAYGHFWQDFGIDVVAFQSLVFGRPELRIFGDAENRRQTLDYLAGIISLAGKLRAGALVFGSPATRSVGDLDKATAWSIAVDFFADLGELAAKHGTCLCIEPNPPEYGCDFIRTAAEGVELVRAVDSRGFRLHLDGGGLTLNGEDYQRAIEDSFEWLAHFHASEPHLVPLGQGGTDHKLAGRVLRSLGYAGWVSVEMRAGDSDNLATVHHALDVLIEAYS